MILIETQNYSEKMKIIKILKIFQEKLTSARILASIFRTLNYITRSYKINLQIP